MDQSSTSPALADLIEQLHKANALFHERRQQLEQVMDGSQFRHQERLNVANGELRQAEEQVEQIEKQIQEFLKHPA